MNKKAIIRNGQIIYGDDIQATVPTPNETEARARREDQKVRHRADMLQPSQVDYYKMYPEKAKNLPEEVRRLLS